MKTEETGQYLSPALSLSIPSCVILAELQLTFLTYKSSHPMWFKQVLTLSQPIGFLTVKLTHRIGVEIKSLNVQTLQHRLWHVVGVFFPCLIPVVSTKLCSRGADTRPLLSFGFPLLSAHQSAWWEFSMCSGYVCSLQIGIQMKGGNGGGFFPPKLCSICCISLCILLVISTRSLWLFTL